MLHLDTSANIVLILALSVWIIYLTDHLLDSDKPQNSASPKYILFSKHRKYFIDLLLIFCAALLVMVIATLTIESIITGCIVGGLLLLYFAGQHFLRENWRKFFPKEIIITIIYVAAVWSIPLLQSGASFEKYQVIIALHFLLVLTNVSLFSMFEKPEDIISHKDSLFGSLATRHLKAIIITLSAISLILAFLLASKSIYSVLPFIIISFVYLIEALFARRTFIHRYYAEITDGAFLLFLIFFLPNFSV